MIKIYFIVDINGLVYVGSTKDTLNQRFCKHKYNTTCSSSILDLDNSIIECIEECTEDNRREREQYWIDNIDCVNKNNTTFDKKEYQKEYSEKNREKKKEYLKEYRAKNRDKRNQQNKEYREKNRDKIKQYKKEYYQKNKLANSN